MPNDPLPPDVLADALQDAVHREIGNVRPAKVRRLMPAEEAREITGSCAFHALTPRPDGCERCRLIVDVAAALAKRERVVEAAREMALAIRTDYLDMRGPAYNTYSLESHTRSVPAINALFQAIADLDTPS